MSGNKDKRNLLGQGQPTARASGRGHGRRLQLAASGGPLSPGHAIDPMVAAAGGIGIPGLGMPEPESTRRALITSAVSALLHLIIIATIVMVGYFAKEVVEEVIIPVEIIQQVELPGSNEAPPIPKMISSAPAASAAAIAAAPAALAATPIAAPAPDLNTSAPTPIDVAQIAAVPLAAQPTPNAASISDYKPLELTPKQLAAPTVDLSGPTATAVRTPVNLDAPQVFGQVPAPGQAYTGLADVTTSRVQTSGAAPSAAGVDTGVAAEFVFGGVEGGNPNAIGTVPCLQSAYVQRYLELIESRTTARWTVPMGASPDEVVSLRFFLDYAGGATDIEVVSASSPEFGNSALTALTAAAPFPPLDDNIRCLADRDKPLNVTFTNPAS
jgi:hypothetical protein